MFSFIILQLPETFLSILDCLMLMNTRICICCGEPILRTGDTGVRDHNLCDPCASLAKSFEDGLAESAKSKKDTLEEGGLYFGG